MGIYYSIYVIYIYKHLLYIIKICEIKILIFTPKPVNCKTKVANTQTISLDKDVIGNLCVFELFRFEW